MDSDSDDELIKSLDIFGNGFKSECNMCWFCDTAGATVQCSMCGIAYYCDTSCLRKDFTKHRPTCIASCVDSEEENEEESDYEYESESEDDEEQVVHHSRGSKSQKMAKMLKSLPVQNGPALSEKQITRLMQLSSSQVDMDKYSKDIHGLKKQLEDLVRTAQHAQDERLSQQQLLPEPVKLKRDKSFTRKREIRALQKKLQELERKTVYAGTTVPSVPIYTPLLVKKDPMFKKYFKLQQLEMPEDQIKQKMQDDGLDPSWLDKPDAVSPNDPGPQDGAYVPLKVREDPKFKKYFKLLRMNMSVEQIKMKMEVDGVDPELLHQPDAVSPNDPGPRPVPQAAAIPQQAARPPPSLVVASVPPASYIPLLVKDDPVYEKYFKLKGLGMDPEHIKTKMKMDGVNPDLFDKPDEVSPNDQGPPRQTESPQNSDGSGISMQQLYAMIMQQQQLIQQGQLTGRATMTGNEYTQAISVEDQMTAELAAAEGAVDDIFGNEEVVKAGGMTMVQQLDKKARREANKKLVEHKDKVKQAIQKLLHATFDTEKDAIEFCKTISAELDTYGLSIGTDENQTWSGRLLIKNKSTRDWYFSEAERLDAGKAYGRLWSLSTLSQCVEQLSGKENQIKNAPDTLKNVSKSKTDMMDKYTQLLKESVKIKHKIFKSQQYAAELKRMETWKIPQSLSVRGDDLINAATVLAESALDMADEEFVFLEKCTRGKKIRAYSAVHVAERAIQLVGIVNKLGAAQVPLQRMKNMKQRVEQVRQDYIGQETEQEEEDDVL